MTFVKLHKPSIAYRADRTAFAHGTMVPVRVCLHDTESGSKAGATHLDDIHAIVRFWSETAFPSRLGAQFIVDAAGNIAQVARASDLTYHVGGFNDGTVGIEQVGFAAMTAEEWHGRPMQLEKVSRLLAYLHTRWHIPLEHAHPTACEACPAGVFMHSDASKVCAASEGHTDPGAGYPFSFVLTRARQIVAHGGWTR